MSGIIWEDIRTNEQVSSTPSPLNQRINDLATAQRLLGFEVDTSQGWDITEPGRRCWKLTRLSLVWGPSVYMVKVRGLDSSVRPNILVAHWWPGVDKFCIYRTDQALKPYYGDERGFYDAGWTNANGDHGVAFGGGSVIQAGSGPDRIWISASPPGQEPQTSDCVRGLGWVGGTNYVHLNMEFQDTQKEAVPPSPDPQAEWALRMVVEGQVVAEFVIVRGAGAGRYRIELVQNGEVVGHLPFNEL